MKQILVVSLTVFASRPLRELLDSRFVSVAPSVEQGSNLLGRDPSGLPESKSARVVQMLAGEGKGGWRERFRRRNSAATP
jgi:hypothetical protein